MNQIKGSGCEHMKFLTFGTSLHKMKHPTNGWVVNLFCNEFYDGTGRGRNKSSIHQGNLFNVFNCNIYM